MKKTLLILSLIILLSSPVFAIDATVTVQWTNPVDNVDGSAIDDLAKVRVWWSKTAGNYSIEQSKDFTTTLPGATITGELTLLNVFEGEIYHFIATAIDTSDNQSDYSNEVNKTINLSPNPIHLDNIIINAPGGIIINTSKITIQ